MKFAQDIFPKGVFKDQKTPGAYIQETLALNLDIYAEKIIEDMHFLLLVTGNDSVGNGKTTAATQFGSYLTWKINNLHKLNNTFTHQNVVFSSKELMDRSFKLPQYSVIVLDEGDDLTTHAMKQTTGELKRYFRKCRQLNQILILILPSFFELPKFYSLARSHCLINVKFMERFERGYFDFYGPNSKKKLYLYGKKEWNYSVQKPDFYGRFFSSYCFFPNIKEETELYVKKKYQDMVEDTEKDKPMSVEEIKRKVIIYTFVKFRKNNPKVTIKDLCIGFGIGETTAYEWLKENREISLENINYPSSFLRNIIITTNEEKNISDEPEQGQ